MIHGPTAIDLWVAYALAGLLGRYPLFDLSVQSLLNHQMLGGFWYAVVMFLLWLRGIRLGKSETQGRILATMLASGVAIVLALAAGLLVSSTPPNLYPGLSRLFPEYLERSINDNCFPSLSTAVLTATSLGILSMHRRAGVILLVLVPFVVSLPRMYVGGHYLSDVMAGFALGTAAYCGAMYFIWPDRVARIHTWLEGRPRLRIIGDLMIFLWMMQLAVGFREVIWLYKSVPILLRRLVA